MLSQKFQRRDAKTQREEEFSYRDGVYESDLIRVPVLSYPRSSSLSMLNIALRLCVFALILCSLSCGSKPTDLRTVIPADSLVYLETNDLGKAVRAITENQSFQRLARTRPDTLALSGIRLAVAVTGFKTSEQPVSDENSVLDFQPRFVAVAETNAWNYQALSFTENKLGEFINETYGGEVVLETSNKHDGKYFVWTAQDGRKTFGLVRGSVIFFGNDESAIEKCLSVTRGEAENIAKNPRISSLSADLLASGYISPDGVAQIANIAGVSLAMRASEEGEVKSFVARVLPEILRKSITEVTWTARKTEQGIEDLYVFETNREVTAVFSETLAPASAAGENLADLLPLSGTTSVTRYSITNPQIAWRSVLLTAQKQTDTLSGNLIAAFSGSLFEPYGVGETEIFLSAIGPQIITARFDGEGDNNVVIATVRDVPKIKKGIAKEIDFSKSPEKLGNVDLWRSVDGEIAAAVFEGKIILGETESVLKCLQAGVTVHRFTEGEISKMASDSNAVAVTVATDFASAPKLVETLAEGYSGIEPLPSGVVTETRFNQKGIERRTVSDFGLIGSIIEQLGKNNYP